MKPKGTRLFPYGKGLTPFSPRLIDVQFWLDASESSTIILNGSTVSQWNDKSGNGINLSQANASLQPTYSSSGLNSKPSVVFDGTSKNLFRGASNILRNVAGMSEFMVLQCDAVPSVAQNWLLITSGASNARYQVTTQTLPKIQTAGRRLDGNSFQIATTSTQDITSGLQVLHSSVIDYSIATATQWINGTQEGTTSSFQTSGVTSNTSSQGMVLAAQTSAGASYANIRVSEIIVSHAAQNDVIRQKIEGYLAWKWDLVGNLPANHPYKNNPPTV